MKSLEVVDGQGTESIAVSKKPAVRQKKVGSGQMQVVEEADDEYAEVSRIVSTEEFIKRKK